MNKLVEFLEMFQAPRFEGFELEHFLTQTAEKTVAEHLGSIGAKEAKFFDSLSNEVCVIVQAPKKAA